VTRLLVFLVLLAVPARADERAIAIPWDEPLALRVPPTGATPLTDWARWLSADGGGWRASLSLSDGRNDAVELAGEAVATWPTLVALAHQAGLAWQPRGEPRCLTIVREPLRLAGAARLGPVWVTARAASRVAAHTVQLEVWLDPLVPSLPLELASATWTLGGAPAHVVVREERDVRWRFVLEAELAENHPSPAPLTARLTFRAAAREVDTVLDLTRGEVLARGGLVLAPEAPRADGLAVELVLRTTDVPDEPRWLRRATLVWADGTTLAAPLPRTCLARGALPMRVTSPSPITTPPERLELAWTEGMVERTVVGEIALELPRGDVEPAVLGTVVLAIDPPDNARVEVGWMAGSSHERIAHQITYTAATCKAGARSPREWGKHGWIEWRARRIRFGMDVAPAEDAIAWVRWERNRLAWRAMPAGTRSLTWELDPRDGALFAVQIVTPEGRGPGVDRLLYLVPLDPAGTPMPRGLELGITARVERDGHVVVPHLAPGRYRACYERPIRPWDPVPLEDAFGIPPVAFSRTWVLPEGWKD